MTKTGSVYVREARHRRRQQAIDYLGGHCSQCERTDDLQFIHRKGMPGTSIGIAITQCWSWQRLQPELDKCELFCPEHADPAVAVHRAGEWRHGTLYGYDAKMCRCDACWQAKARAWQRAGRVITGRRLSNSGKFSEHGTYPRYQAGCRCRPCKEANRLRVAAFRAAVKARAAQQ